jgi:hypothetical protein
MANLPDKRLQERALRKGALTADDVSDLLEASPDLSDNLREVTEEDLEELRGELVSEASVRAERIALRLTEDRSVGPKIPEPPPQPLDAEL